MKVVVVAGIPGSGSTTVLKHALKEANYIHVNYGDVMLEIALGMELVEERDSLRKLPQKPRKKFRKKLPRQ
ncbi:hypothetical protein GCM10025861_22580 [Methanobacterium petrolearium]|nr:hypothetical protein GCM10025861_22580 [Methanobacterium petrolearium]